MMTKYVSVAEMVAIEKEADASGLSYAQMMENAGAGLANVVAREYAAYSERGVLGWVGSGNNGGDTLVALAHLAQRGWRATAYLIRQRAQDDPLSQAPAGSRWEGLDPLISLLISRFWALRFMDTPCSWMVSWVRGSSCR